MNSIRHDETHEMEMSTQAGPFTLSENEAHYFSSPQIWWVIPDEVKGAKIVIEHNSGSETLLLHPADSGILGINARRLTVCHGQIAIMPSVFTTLVKLQAFIDRNKAVPVKAGGKAHYGFAHYHYKGEPSHRIFEYWLISQTLRQTPDMIRIISILRETEWYWVVNYLLSHAADEASLRDLGKRYGLSVSHFRRLAKMALGNTTKVELCNWRLVAAVLELVDDNLSITEIALKHGYASLSHFSNDVKNTFGFSPKALKSVIDSDLKNE
ncbi:AraC-like DNA-binding protein [Pantoea sp. SORGH_AS 659]|nr:AraC-like DNA-binding protein [Pantoea sp. SORGH_AS_0659]